ncbi:MAG: hypothetical protein ACREF9_21225, partial [Opitutaceae bacterium]
SISWARCPCHSDPPDFTFNYTRQLNSYLNSSVWSHCLIRNDLEIVQTLHGFLLQYANIDPDSFTFATISSSFFFVSGLEARKRKIKGKRKAFTRAGRGLS